MTPGLTAETSDCYSVAVKVDDAVRQSRDLSPDRTKVGIRQQRIAAAIQRSKSEYKAEHAYTERKASFLPEASPLANSATKGNRQKLEFTALSMFCADPPQHTECLQAILSLFDPSTESRSLGGLSRELMDVGLQSAIACGDMHTAMALAKQSSALWKGQFAGTSACAADAFVFSQHPQESLTPLFMATATGGLQYPILHRLSFSLQSILCGNAHTPMKATAHLLSLVDRAVEWRRPPFEKNIFEPQKEASRTTGNQAGMDAVSNELLDTHMVALELGLDSSAELAFQETWKRLSRGLDVVVQQPEKSVRDL